ncbi:putative alpha-galactosidase [Phycisphaera mikurensis NBRC 102666]|uniref:Putative alpha-galactosidase n=2 Tax=Phycisphaera TaxID=666508 RepID=I0IAS1_PHYMF|nr:putative alpha-galactosidase [Phycisphaera mikurensis NBRC 102666]
MPRPVHLTFLGAGSNFCSTLCRDLLLIPGNAGGELRLVDVDRGRLDRMHRVIEKLIEATGNADKWKVVSSTDRRAVLPGTHYAVCCVEVSGVDCVAWDNDIPLKHGIDQCIGDTLGPGGLFKALRTVPVFLDALRDMRELCPGALMLNYTNPMGILCLAAGRAVPEVPVVGLCHSVQGTSHLLAEYAGVDYETLRWECAGINHLAWFTKLERNGEDLYAKTLRAKFEAEVAAGFAEAEAGVAVHDAQDAVFGEEKEQPYEGRDLVRKDMCLQFGAFITESSGHLSEYLPWYRKNERGRALLRRGYDGGSRFYATNWPHWRTEADALRDRLVSGEEQIDLKRSWEYGTFIIEAIEKDAPWRIHGNVMNRVADPAKASPGEAGKLITNLPGDGCVEVACLVDGNGVQPTRYGALPAPMARVCASNMAFIDLAATAVIQRSKEAAVHALLLDPLTAAVLSPAQIREMAMEMFEAEKDFLPGYA